MLNSKKTAIALPAISEYHEIFVYSLKDIKTDSFGSVFEAKSDEAAKRSISHHCDIDPDTLFSRYPDDYQLWKIGAFNRNSGVFISVPEYMCTVKALLRPVKSLS